MGGLIMKFIAAGLIAVVVMGAAIESASAQSSCREKKTVAECMKCVQARGLAGSSGGHSFCAGVTDQRGDVPKKRKN
jgi:hypothetical protein